MGHHVGSKSSIIPLIDRLNKYPVGLPDSEKLRQILALLFSEAEAYIASRFPLQEATLAELAKATRIVAAELQPQLEQMAEKGLLIDLCYQGQTYYLLMPGLIGFFEFSFMKVRDDLPQAELARLMHEYLYANPQGGMAKEFFDSKIPLTRTLVYDDQVPVSSTVTSYENARSIVEQAGYGAVGICYCRHKKQHLQQPCEKGAPMEGTCISLGSAAKFLVRRGFAEQQSTEQLLAIIDRSRQLGLTQITDNIREKPAFICNCCSCCCELLTGVKMGYRDGIGKSPFLLQLDPERCNGCGRCIAACNVAALQAGGENQVVRVDEQLCLGCAACLPVCKQDALILVERKQQHRPLKNRTELMKKRLLERGRATPFVISGMKKKLKKLVIKSAREMKIP